jgi:hypothetical protein
LYCKQIHWDGMKVYGYLRISILKRPQERRQ